MNITLPLGIYASVQRHLGLSLVFPGDLSSWEVPLENSSAMLNGYLAEWVVLTEGAINQSFNATDAGPFTWGKFWPQVAQWYGLSYLPPSMKDGDYKQVDSKYKTRPAALAQQAESAASFFSLDGRGSRKYKRPGRKSLTPTI